MSRRNVCRYFLNGKCHFGDNCKFLHQKPGQATSSVPPTDHSCNDPRSCKERIVDDLKNERNTSWFLTCYAHWKYLPNDISGEASFEELRAAAYEGAKSGMHLRDLALREADLFRAKAAEFEALQRNPYKGPAIATTLSPFPTQTIFGKPVATSTIFQNPKQGPSVGGFGGSAGPKTPVFQPSGFNPTPNPNSFSPSPSPFPSSSSFPPTFSPSPNPFTPTPFGPSASPTAVSSSPNPFPPSLTSFPSASPSPFPPPVSFPSASPSPFPANSPFNPSTSPFNPSSTPAFTPSSFSSPFNPPFNPSPFNPASNPSPFNPAASNPSPFNPASNLSPFNPASNSSSFNPASPLNSGSSPSPAPTGDVDKIWFAEKWELGQIPEDEPPVAVR